MVNGRANLVAPDWAHRLSEDGNGILFTDEVNTAPPSVQAALLRVCLDKVAGDCELGEMTSVVAAANPPELAADGWDLAPPLANRFCHLDWQLPPEIVAQGMTASWPDYELPQDSGDFEKIFAEEKSIVAGFISSRPELTTVIPDGSGDQGRAFPTPRSWEMVAKLVAYARSWGLEDGVLRLLVSGSIGQSAGIEFLNYRKNLDLPDSELVLSGAATFSFPQRADQTYVILAGAINLAERKAPDEASWNNFGVLLEKVVAAGHPDIAVASAKRWLSFRPEGASPNSDLLTALVPLMKEARLI